MLVAWTQKVKVKQLWMNEFCMELRSEMESEGADFWIIFVHASTEAKERQQQ